MTRKSYITVPLTTKQALDQLITEALMADTPQDSAPTIVITDQAKAEAILEEYATPSNFTKAKAIIGFLLMQDKEDGRFKKPERCDERAADYAQDIASYLDVQGEYDVDNPDYAEIFDAAMEASGETFPTPEDDDTQEED